MTLPRLRCLIEQPATTWRVLLKFSPLVLVIATATGGVVWGVTSDYVGGVVAFVFVVIGGIVTAWSWSPFARMRQRRLGLIEQSEYVPRSATSTTEPMVDFFRRRFGRRTDNRVK